MGADYYIIDRRQNQKGKSDSNRHRFLRRYRSTIAAAVKQVINARSITEAVKDGVQVRVPADRLKEYSFIPDYETGIRRGVNIGNTQYKAGDLIRKPPSQQGGGGGEGSKDGEGEDDFIFNLSPEELERYFFEDLELPNLTNRNLNHIEEYRKVRNGFSTAGLPCNLDLVRSMRKSLGRELSLEDDDETTKAMELQRELEFLISIANKTKDQVERIRELKATLAEIEINDVNMFPSMDKMDMQYRTHSMIPVPNTSAVMFCLMDVSISMGEHEKDLAKRFFILLYLFLRREYDKIEVRFIRHHTIAKEVDEDEFFHSRESGGTVVSSVMDEMNRIIAEDYSDGSWNVYAAQASDGDNFPEDNRPLHHIMVNSIMKKLQYFAYIEVTDPNDSWRGDRESSIWETYQKVQQDFPQMATARVQHRSQIFSVFKELFKKDN